MKRVQITNGAYGLRLPGQRRVTPVTAKDAPIDLEDAEADRLVGLGVATVVSSETAEQPSTAVATPVTPSADDGEGEDVDGDNQDAEGVEDGEDDDIPSYSVDMPVAELKELMELHGLPVKSSMSRAKMVEALDALFEVEDAPPECSAADPVL